MSAPAPARQVIWPSEFRGWSLALSALGFAVAMPWIGLGSLLATIAFFGAGPYVSIQGTYTSADLRTVGLGGIAAMVFAVAVILLLPGLARRARSLRRAVTVCAGFAALSGALAVPLVIMVAAPAMPFS